MHGDTIFAALALLIAIQGVVLSLARPILPSSMRCGLLRWQAGTLAIAGGFAASALQGTVTPSIAIGIASLFVSTGLTFYYQALQEFRGRQPRRRDFLVVALALPAVLCFAMLRPDITILASVTLCAWVWIMLACVWALVEASEAGPKLGSYVMAGLFTAGIAATILRTIVHAISGATHGFAEGWGALANLAFLGLLPVVGATVFLLMCVGRLKTNLEYVASTDHLTDLSNRRLLSSFGQTVFRRARQDGSGFSVAVIDIDRFKSINDSFGHAVGDEVLVHVSRRLKESIRKSDFIARSGGEEFVIVLEHPRPEEIRATIERLRLAVEGGPFRLGSVEIRITVSAGVADYHSADGGFAEVLRRADDALYRAKSLGRNRVELASDSTSWDGDEPDVAHARPL